jgi:hypothetical protein
LLRDAMLQEIGAGTSEIRGMLIGRELSESPHNNIHHIRSNRIAFGRLRIYVAFRPPASGNER